MCEDDLPAVFPFSQLSCIERKLVPNTLVPHHAHEGFRKPLPVLLDDDIQSRGDIDPLSTNMSGNDGNSRGHGL